MLIFGVVEFGILMAEALHMLSLNDSEVTYVELLHVHSFNAWWIPIHAFSIIRIINAYLILFLSELCDHGYKDVAWIDCTFSDEVLLEF